MTNAQNIENLKAEYEKLAAQVKREGETKDGKITIAYSKMCRVRKQYHAAVENQKIRKLFDNE